MDNPLERDTQSSSHTHCILQDHIVSHKDQVTVFDPWILYLSSTIVYYYRSYRQSEETMQLYFCKSTCPFISATAKESTAPKSSISRLWKCWSDSSYFQSATTFSAKSVTLKSMDSLLGSGFIISILVLDRNQDGTRCQENSWNRRPNLVLKSSSLCSVITGSVRVY